jgi:two-component system, NtrC family, sensor kinase
MSLKVKRLIVSYIVLLVAIIALSTSLGVAQDQSVLITKDMIELDVIMLGQLDGWRYKSGNFADGANPNLDVSNWQRMKPSEIGSEMLNDLGVVDGWFRIKIRLDSSLTDIPLFWRIGTWGAIDLFVDGELVKQYGTTSSDRSQFVGYNPLNKLAKHADLELGRDYVIAFYTTDHLTSVLNRTIVNEPFRYDPLIRLSTEEYNERIISAVDNSSFWAGAMAFATTVIALIFWILYYQNRSQHILRAITITSTVIAFGVWFSTNLFQHNVNLLYYTLFGFIWQLCVLLYTGLIVYSLHLVLTEKVPFRIWHVAVVVTFVGVVSYVSGTVLLPTAFFIIAAAMVIRLFIKHRSSVKNANEYLFWGAICTFMVAILVLSLDIFQIGYNVHINSILMSCYYLAIPLSMLMYINERFKDTLVEVQSQSEKVVMLSREKQDILAAQNEILEAQVADRTAELQESLEELKKAQEQLIQSEKMASLGQLTAGIAHEIKNPLNFVTNFSDLTRELVMEAREEMAGLGLTPDQVDRFEPILGDIEMNVSKIYEHGRRADNIVKGMLQHSRGKAGERQSTDINELIGEYLNLAYHGLRAQDPSFNVTLKTEFDPEIGIVDIVPQDFSRAILNLVNNACFAADQKKRNTDIPGFKPTVTVTTKKLGNEVEIVVHDNGTGIPDHVKSKIFEPFFTTKPTGVGTGLGLSLTYEIIVNQHNGSLEVNSQAGDFTEFRIIIPQTQ